MEHEQPGRWDVIVLGAGVIGAAALDALARRGARVLGLDRYELPNAMGSSHGGTRVIRTAYFEGQDYVPLLQESWSAWHELQAWRGTTLLRQTGVLHFGPSDLVEPVLACARDLALPHEAVTGAEIAARWPAFRPGPDDIGIHEDGGGLLRAERCVSALLERAMANGADIRGMQRVLGVECGAHEVVVHTASASHRAARVVLALGAWSEGEANPLPVTPAAALPLTIERQVQLWFQPRDRSLVTPERMPVFLRFGHDSTFYGLPQAELPGVKVCQHHGGASTHADALDRTFHSRDETKVRAFVRDHLPAADGPLLSARVCMYSTTPDEHFIVGAHPNHPERAVLACGFSGHGFKLAPAVGRLVADLVDGAASGRVPMFDPRRFLGPVAPSR